MAFSADVELNFIAQTADIKKQLADMGDKEAAKAFKKLETQYRRTERAAKRLGKQSRLAGRKAKEGFEAAKKAVAGFGGAVGAKGGQVANLVESLVQLGGVAGPAGVVVAGAALAMTGMGVAAGLAVVGVVKLIRSAEDLAKTLGPLQDAGIFTIPPETMDAIREFNGGLDAVKLSASALAVVLAGELAETFSSVIRMAGKTAFWMLENVDTMVKWGRTALDVAAKITAFMGPLGSMVITTMNLVDATKILDASTGSLDARYDAFIATLGNVTEAKKKVAAVDDDMQARAARAVELAKRPAQARFEATVALAEQREEEHQKELARLRAEATASDEGFAKRQANLRTVHQLQQQGALMAMNSTLQAAETFAALATQRREDEVSSLSAKIQELKANDDLTKQDKAKLKRLKTERKEASKLAKRAFAAQKALQVGTAIGRGATAFMGLLSYFAPLSGFAAPALAGAIVTPALTAQLATIAAQKPPSFAAGGMATVGGRAGPDHALAFLGREEAVTTPRGTDAAGGAAGIEALNSGRGMGTSIEVSIDRKIIASAVVDALGGSQVRAVLEAWGGLPAGRALVYGGA